MSITNTDLANLGGRFNTALGMLFGFTDANRMGEMAIQGLVNTLALLFYDDKEGIPVSGFPHSGLSDSNCLAAATADLVFDVSGGWGMLFDASLLAADPFGSGSYQMVVLGSGSVGETLAAHDPANPRVDLIALKPARTAKEPATRNIKDPTTGALSTAAVNLKILLDAEVAVITGTPAATPVDPILPAGHLLIARAEVPAAAGAAILRDARNILAIGNFVAGSPGNNAYQKGHVHPGVVPGELLVTEATPASMAVVVDRGRSVLGGTIRHHPREILAIAAANPLLPRIDIVAAKRDGTLEAVTGTPAATPVAPAAPANSTTVANVAVAAAAVAVVNANITDTRIRKWLDGSEAVRDLTLPHQALSVRPWVAAITGVSAPNPNTKRVSYEIQYPDGAPYDGAFPLRVLVTVRPAAGVPLAFVGDFSPSSGIANWKTLLPDHGTLADFAVFPGPAGIVNISDGGSTGNAGTLMLCEVSAAIFSVEVCQDFTALPTGTHFVDVTPLGSDGAPLGRGAFQAVTF